MTDDLRLSGLIDIKKILKLLKIKFFLSGGTMLGAVRNSDFIAWDWNFSVVAVDEKFPRKIPALIDAVAKYGFTNNLRHKRGYYSFHLKRDGLKFYIENMQIIKGYATLFNYKFPARFFEKSEKAHIRGVKFPVPSPAEEICELWYGKNWRTPIKVDHRNKVINQDLRILKTDGIRRIKK